jgi:hypothetical protein
MASGIRYSVVSATGNGGVSFYSRAKVEETRRGRHRGEFEVHNCELTCIRYVRVPRAGGKRRYVNRINRIDDDVAVRRMAKHLERCGQFRQAAGPLDNPKRSAPC